MSLNYDLVKPEYTYGDSRIDFYMERNGEKFLTEVKGCTLADDLHPGTGLFPDAPTERGVKHLHELAKAAKEGYHCCNRFCNSDEWNLSGTAKRGETAGV